MEKIIVLGTGTASTVESFNTCFILEDNNQDYLLVDTGGGNGILRQLKYAHVDLNQIHNIFLSHKHLDHLLGMLWVYRFVDISMSKGNYEGVLNIYCHDELADILRNLINTLISEKQRKHLDKRIFINVVKEHDVIRVLNYDLKILDVAIKGDKQYGFKTILNNGKSLVFLGDQPLSDKLYDDVRNVDYLLHESYCLDKEADSQKPYEKNHDTAKSAGRKAQLLGIKNLILYHTHENLGKMRKEAYTNEAKQEFSGNVYVPDDLEIIEFVKKKTY